MTALLPRLLHSVQGPEPEVLDPGDFDDLFHDFDDFDDFGLDFMI